MENLLTFLGLHLCICVNFLGEYNSLDFVDWTQRLQVKDKTFSSSKMSIYNTSGTHELLTYKGSKPFASPGYYYFNVSSMN